MGTGTLDLWSIASLAGRSAALFAGGMLALTLLMDQLHRWFGFGRKGHWELIPSAILIIGGLWFSFQFSMIYFARRRISGVEGVLDESSRNPELLSTPCFGFVAMEGNLFTGHQIFIIFVTPKRSMRGERRGVWDQSNQAYLPRMQSCSRTRPSRATWRRSKALPNCPVVSSFPAPR